MMLRLWNRDAIRDRRGGVKRTGRDGDNEDDDENETAAHEPGWASACDTKASGGSAPRISTESLTTVFGTPVT